jgi:GT2 family glycosyltransferase
VIPVRNDPRVADVVGALQKQLPLDGEIVVADDGTPGTLPPLPGGQVRIVPVHRGDPGAARNEAVESSGGRILLFTDADVILPPDWIATAMALFEDPSVQAVQGNSRTRGKKALAALLDREYREFVQSHAETGFADMCDTRCFGIRREIFEKHPFEEAEPFTEDSDLGRRLFEAGIRIRFAPEWEVEHHARGSLRQELIRFRGYASASQRRLLRTGLDLFRAPGSPMPRGPGADLLRVALSFPFTARVLSRGVWALARALGRASEIPWGAPAPIFLRARRAAMLSGRLDPDEETQRRLAARRPSRILTGRRAT